MSWYQIFLILIFLVGLCNLIRLPSIDINLTAFIFISTIVLNIIIPIMLFPLSFFLPYDPLIPISHMKIPLLSDNLSYLINNNIAFTSVFMWKLFCFSIAVLCITSVILVIIELLWFIQDCLNCYSINLTKSTHLYVSTYFGFSFYASIIIFVVFLIVTCVTFFNSQNTGGKFEFLANISDILSLPLSIFLFILSKKLNKTNSKEKSEQNEIPTNNI
jgi:hypothetical protein